MPEDLQPILRDNKIDGSIIVQSDQSKEENIFQLANALQHDFVKGVAGWIDLQTDYVDENLEYYKEFKKMKGFRHVLQAERQRDFMLRPNFKRGIGKLREFGYTYDILIFPDQLAYTIEFVKAFPDQPFVLDHIAKPYIKDKKIEGWKKDIEALASFENVYCKVSGMVTEAHWKNWTKDDFVPYLDVIAESFGSTRLMYGSDWPVCLVAASYEQVVGLVAVIISRYFSPHEQDLIFGEMQSDFTTYKKKYHGLKFKR